ncbi:MAG: class II fructose-bisphosphate aldolase [Candidatus Omnitrophica bacterium]|nr:class II fructose-bisphosphate aldolase [Candidatus Omnitrophota bacterium]MDE2009105.1 class II fructose-bisphosphate aldolase [Candidatus Omnitrophota bacterium]MDE2214230.1 class II fructose-bisphosphate aldolase [Candidatus Omnitrophota bacterium]MDE2231267.1 class II fructose-bisphosphate aldolase [Candidatus Omnitrophota bacterium]
MAVKSGFDVDATVQKLVMSDNIKEKEALAREIQAEAKSRGVFLASIHEVYMARGKGQGKNFTTPAMNLRCLTYHLARAIFRVAKRLNAGAFIFEIAKSEMGYTAQPPIEYSAVILAAAVKEGHRGPVFVQGDHCQIKASSYFENKAKEVSGLKDMVADCIAAGFYNIDVDSSTTVKLDRPTLTEQQRDNFEVCADMSAFIRKIQPKGLQISIGGEIGEVGHKNSTVEELVAFTEGYNKALPKGLVGLSKISVQTGTSHGGTVLPDGSIAKANVDFDTLKNISAAARQKFGMGGAVQHGASTLSDDQFHKFPEVNTVEIHLATNFQNKTLDNLPKDLYQKMMDWTKANCQSERKSTDTEEQFLYKARKRALGQFKKEIYGLPESVKEGIAAQLEKNFEFLFKQLNVGDTKDFVTSIVKPVDTAIGLRQTQAHLDGEGDD